jgi:short-subunit dehydrogenase
MDKSAFNQNAVIITGASSGIGRELALQLADQGAYLTLASRNLNELEKIVSECRRRGGKAQAVKTDVGIEDDCRRLIEQAVSEFGRIETLINNAGYSISGRLSELPDLSGFQNVMDVNFMGSVWCTYYALPHLKKHKGRIVMVSSVLGKVAIWGSAVYAASKFAMAGFSDIVRNELRSEGVSLTAIYPGYVVTNFAGNVVKPDGQRMGQQGLKLYTDRMMSAAECARIIIKAAFRRKREKVLSFSGKLGVFVNKISPRLVDWISQKAQKHRAKKQK